jgi:hypothetical protein
MRVAEELDWKGLIKIHHFLQHLLVLLKTVLQDGRFNHQESTIVL